MRKLESFWHSKKEWIRFTEKGIVLREDAPKEAQESYKKYLKQLKEKKESI